MKRLSPIMDAFLMPEVSPFYADIHPTGLYNGKRWHESCLTRSLGNHPELVEGWFDRLTMKPLSLPKGDKLTMIA
jgi:hypothetical protein